MATKYHTTCIMFLNRWTFQLFNEWKCWTIITFELTRANAQFSRLQRDYPLYINLELQWICNSVRNCIYIIFTYDWLALWNSLKNSLIVHCQGFILTGSAVSPCTQPCTVCLKVQCITVSNYGSEKQLNFQAIFIDFPKLRSLILKLGFSRLLLSKSN